MLPRSELLRDPRREQLVPVLRAAGPEGVLVPRVQAKAPPRRIAQPNKRFEFEQAICVEGFSAGFTAAIPRGRIYPRSHPMVEAHPEFWRLLGPRPDQEGGE
jgi:hypothetical protein